MILDQARSAKYLYSRKYKYLKLMLDLPQRSSN